MVSGQTTLSGLHRIIQAAFGWWNYHLHLFEIARVRYSQPEFEIAEEWDEDIKNEKRFRLSQFDFKKGDKFYYEYDFGDSWRHEIRVEQRLPKEQGIRYPKCTGGERARPKMSAARQATNIFSKRSKSPLIPHTKNIWNGRAARSTRNIQS